MNLFLLLTLLCQASADVESWIGMEKSMMIAVKNTTLAAPSPSGTARTSMPQLVLLAVNPVKMDAASGTRVYEIRYIGLREGDHDLRDYLQFSEGVKRQMVPRMQVSIADPLPPNHRGELTVPPVLLQKSVTPGFSRTMGAIGTCLWTLTLGVFCFVWWNESRGRRVPVPEVVSVDDLPRKLRLAELKMLTPQGLAEIERQLLDRWLQELGIQNLRFIEGIRALENHPQGAELLAAFENWRRRLDVGPAKLPALLRKYVEIPDATDAEQALS